MSGANHLGTFIRECRSSLGYTSRKIADLTRNRPGLTGISHSNLLAMEKGRHVPTFDKILTLSYIYNVPTQHFEEQLRQDMLPSATPEPGASFEGLSEGAHIAKSEGNHKLALELYTQALTVASHGNQPWTESTRRRNVWEARLHTANCRARVGLLRVAKDDLEELLADADLEPHLIALASFYLSRIHRERKNYRLALLHAEAALRFAEEESDATMVGKILTSIANILDATGEAARAVQYYERARAEFAKLGDRRAVGVVTRNLGTTYFQLKEYDAAIDHLQEGLVIAQETGDRRGQAYALANLARANYLGGDLPTAAGFAKRAKGIAEQEEYLDVLFSSIFYLWKAAEYEHKGHLAQVYAERLNTLRRRLETRSDEVEEWAGLTVSKGRS